MSEYRVLPCGCKPAFGEHCLTCEPAGRTRDHDGEECGHCHGRVGAYTGSYWNAPDELWMRVVGREGGVLCPPCFTAEARALGIHVSWRAVEEQPWQFKLRGYRDHQSTPGRVSLTIRGAA